MSSIIHPTMPSKPQIAFLPVLSLLFSATLWGVLWYPLRLLAEQGLSGQWSTLIIYSAATLVGLPLLWRYRNEWQQPGLLCALACASGWCNIAFILAVIEGNVVRVLLLFYLSPLWTVLLGRLLLGERLSSAARATLLLAMTGSLIMLWNPALGIPWPEQRADWLAISSGFAFALSNVLVRKLQHAPVMIKAAITWWGVVALVVVMLLVSGEPLPEVSIGAVAAAVALGGIGIVLMTLAVVYGVTHMPVHRSAVILLFELVAGSLSSQWLTAEVVQANEWAGGTLILAAAWLAARSAK